MSEMIWITAGLVFVSVLIKLTPVVLRARQRKRQVEADELKQAQEQEYARDLFASLGLTPKLHDKTWHASGPLSDAVHFELSLEGITVSMVFHMQRLSSLTRVELKTDHIHHHPPFDQDFSLKHGSSTPVKLEVPLSTDWPWLYELKPLRLKIVLDQALTVSLELLRPEDTDIKPCVLQLLKALERAEAFIQELQQGWAAYKLTSPPLDERYATALFYLAASELAPDRQGTWALIEEQEAHLWKTFKGLDEMRPNPKVDPGELLQRSTRVYTQQLVHALEQRGELTRMWREGTLETELALTWLIHQPVETQTRRAIVSTLDRHQLATFLDSLTPEAFETLIEDPDEPLLKQPALLFEALGLRANPSSTKKVSLILTRDPASGASLSKEGYQLILEHQPQILTGALLERALAVVHPTKQLLVLDNLMQTASPWESFVLILGRSSWLDDLRYNLSDAMRWSTLSTLLNHVSESTTSEQLLSLKILLYGSISSPPEAKVLEQFLELVEARRLQPSLWTTFDELIEYDDSLAKIIKPYHQKWRSSEHVGGLSLSEDHSNAGALSVVHAEHGSLTIQDEQEPS